MSLTKDITLNINGVDFECEVEYSIEQGQGGASHLPPEHCTQEVYESLEIYKLTLFVGETDISELVGYLFDSIADAILDDN